MKMKRKSKNNKKVEIRKATKQIKTTLDFLEIDKVNEFHIDLRDGKKVEVVIGIKLDPHSLFLDSYQEQKRRIHQLRSALNRLPFDIFHGFVFNPVNLDSYLLMLIRQMSIETDEVIVEMLQDDIDKAQAFIQAYRELEFFMMIKGKPSNKLEDKYHQLLTAIKSAGFEPKALNRLDFDNYISYAFENQLINDYYFSRGVFDHTEGIEIVQQEAQEEEDE